jgi:hypothetical protein
MEAFALYLEYCDPVEQIRWGSIDANGPDYKTLTMRLHFAQL